MKNDIAIRELIRQWLSERNGQLAASEIGDDYLILKERVITSLQVTDLLLFIESLRGTPVTLQEIKPAAFGSINAIYDNFFQGVTRCV